MQTPICPAPSRFHSPEVLCPCTVPIVYDVLFPPFYTIPKPCCCHGYRCKRRNCRCNYEEYTESLAFHHQKQTGVLSFPEKQICPVALIQHHLFHPNLQQQKVIRRMFPLPC